MIIGIHGYLGSFKTATDVMLAKVCHDDGYNIMSNQPLLYGKCIVCGMIYRNIDDYDLHKGIHDRLIHFFNSYIPLDMDLIRRYSIIGEPLPWKKLFILGDEWQQVMDARRSMDGDELINTYFIMQTRKRHIILGYCTSMRGMNDNRLRDNTNIIIKCYKRHKEKGTICYDDLCTKPHYADWYIINVAAGKGVHKYWKNPEISFEMYDTEHIISPISHLSEKDMHDITSTIKQSLGIGGNV